MRKLSTKYRFTITEDQAIVATVGLSVRTDAEADQYCSITQQGHGHSLLRWTTINSEESANSLDKFNDDLKKKTASFKEESNIPPRECKGALVRIIYR